MFIQNKKLHILIVAPFTIPAQLYGGSERVIWDLGKTLVDKGHKVSFLVNEGSKCEFAAVIPYNRIKDFNSQIPDDVDLVHFNFNPEQEIKKPYLSTVHGNPPAQFKQDIQSVFISKNHAERYGSEAFVYNGLDWNNYPKPNFNQKRKAFHFLGKAAWKVKNLKGAINITKKANENLMVLGGYRFNFKMGWRFTFDTHVSFKGMVDNSAKAKYLNTSKGLIFPVLWHEPFGLAIIESLYFGCPVFGTPYGSLSELITKETGFLSTSEDELVKAIKNVDEFNQLRCNELAQDQFSAKRMTESYLGYYEKVLNGETLNKIHPKEIKRQESKYLPFD